MIQILTVVFAVSHLACNNENKPRADAKPNVPAVMHGFTPAYSASYVMDSATNTETILELWKSWKTGDLSTDRGHFADSLTFASADGTVMMGQADTLMKGMQAYRSSFKGMDGKVDSISLQETWRFDKAGKIDFMFQSVRKGILPHCRIANNFLYGN